jgi:hypothetical protein
VIQVVAGEFQVADPREKDPDSIFEPKPGGWTRLDTEQESVREVAQFAVEEIGKQRNSPNYAQLGDIVSARAHVVSGYRYNIVLNRHETSCPVSTADAATNCPTTSTELCRVDAVDQSWMPDRYTLLGFNCVPAATGLDLLDLLLDV